MDIHIWYTLLSALVGGLLGALGRLGEVFFHFSDSCLRNITIHALDFNLLMIMVFLAT